MSLSQIREFRTARKSALDAAGAILTRVHKERRKMTGEERQEFNRRQDDGDRLLRQIEALENGQPTAAPASSFAGAELRSGTTDPAIATASRQSISREERSAFRDWALTGGSALMPATEARALSASTSGAGAATIPQGFQYTLEVALKAYGGILDTAEIIPTGQRHPVAVSVHQRHGQQW